MDLPSPPDNGRGTRHKPRNVESSSHLIGSYLYSQSHLRHLFKCYYSNFDSTRPSSPPETRKMGRPRKMNCRTATSRGDIIGDVARFRCIGSILLFLLWSCGISISRSIPPMHRLVSILRLTDSISSLQLFTILSLSKSDESSELCVFCVSGMISAVG